MSLFGIAVDFYQIRKQLTRIEQKIDALTKAEVREMATNQEILAEIAKQKTLVEGVRVLVQQLRDAQGDPAAMQAILDGLNENDTALALLQNTPAEGQPVA